MQELELSMVELEALVVALNRNVDELEKDEKSRHAYLFMKDVLTKMLDFLKEDQGLTNRFMGDEVAKRLFVLKRK